MLDALHAEVGTGEPTLYLVLGVAALASAVVFGAALAAYLRRQSGAYLLVALALGALLARTAVAGVTLAGGLSDSTHHLLEHGLDVAMAGLVIAAVYYARTIERDNP